MLQFALFLPSSDISALPVELHFKDRNPGHVLCYLLRKLDIAFEQAEAQQYDLESNQLSLNSSSLVLGRR